MIAEDKESMAFINEIMPEEEKEKLPFSVTTDRDGSKPTLWKWTIDRERNAYLVFSGSAGGGYVGLPLTKHFVLSWDGELTYLSADPGNCYYDDSGGVVQPWRIHNLKSSPALDDHKDEVLKLIEEAFRTMGKLYDGEQYASVNVDFDSPIAS